MRSRSLADRPIDRMAAVFFPENWESFTKEELLTARARLAGFIEATPDKEQILREVIRVIKRFLKRKIDEITGVFKTTVELHVTSHERKNKIDKICVFYKTQLLHVSSHELKNVCLLSSMDMPHNILFCIFRY